MTPEELLSSAAAGKMPPLTLLRGENAYLTRELKKSIRASGAELLEREFGKAGPDGAVGDMGAGLSLFRTKQVVWLKATGAPSGWTKDGDYHWKRLREQADGEDLAVLLQTDGDKRVKWDSTGAKIAVDMNVDAGASLAWLKRMNEARGNALGADKLRFLSVQDADLLTLDNWVELWSLGGDLWAERSLGWGGAGAGKGEDPFANPAFAWVDAVIAGRKREAVRLAKKLLDDGSDAIPLVALLGKSVRILALLDAGRRPVGQPDFLVQKLSRTRAQMRPGQVKRLLKLSAEADRLLKGGGSKQGAALLMRL